MNDGRNILSDDKAKILREIIEQEEGGQRIDPDGEAAYKILLQSRSGGKLAAARDALDRAIQQTEAVKAHLSAARLALPQEELLEGVRVEHKTPTAPELSAREEQLWEAMTTPTHAQELVEAAIGQMRRAQYEGKIIAVDFDGTLCEAEWPRIGAPKQGVINCCKEVKGYGAKLILWTNRTGQQLDEAVEWCAQHGLHFDAVNENLPEIIKAYGGDTRKIVADWYIDDKAVSAAKVEEAYRGWTE